MKLTRILTTAVLCFFLISGIALSYDKNSGTFKEFTDPDISTPRLGQSIVDVVVTGSAIGTMPMMKYSSNVVDWKFAEGTFAQRGMGYVVGNYIVTAAHLVIPKEMMIQMTDAGYWLTPVVKVKKLRITIGNLIQGGVSASIFYLSREDDLAILKFDEPWLITQPLGYQLAPSWGYIQISPETSVRTTFLNSGDALAIIVKKRLPDGSRDWTYEVKYGKVVTNYPSCSISKAFITGVSGNDFVMDIEVFPGDSGSPVFAFKDGVPIMVGVVSGIVRGEDDKQFLSYASKVDFVKRIVEIK